MIATGLAIVGVFVISLFTCVLTSIMLTDLFIQSDEGLGVVWLGGWIGFFAAVTITVLTTFFFLLA